MRKCRANSNRDQFDMQTTIDACTLQVSDKQTRILTSFGRVVLPGCLHLIIGLYSLSSGPVKVTWSHSYNASTSTPCASSQRGCRDSYTTH